MKFSKIRTINWILAACIIAINCYIILVPFWPTLQFWIDQNNTHEDLTEAVEAVKPTKIYKDNTIVIPRMRLSEKIHEGTDIAVVNKGVWRRPGSSDPTKDSNTVLAGHRFTYKDPKGVFYHLDKLKTGDKLSIFWDKQRYTYQVESIKTVAASASEVEAESPEPLLTLYTCTPLWNAKDRLVVTAKLIEEPTE